MQLAHLHCASALAVLLLQSPIAAAQDKVLDADYGGAFEITFGTAPDGSDELFFAGEGWASPMGASLVDGYSRSVPGSPGCFAIVHDEVVLTDAANGHTLWLENSGEDCLDFTDPLQVTIVGSGSTGYLGGTGPWRKAGGSGTWEVRAVVEEFFAGGVRGRFETLQFVGLVTR